MEATVIRSKDFKDTEVIHSLISEEILLLTIGKKTQDATGHQSFLFYNSKFYMLLLGEWVITVLQATEQIKIIYHSDWIRSVKDCSIRLRLMHQTPHDSRHKFKSWYVIYY